MRPTLSLHNCSPIPSRSRSDMLPLDEVSLPFSPFGFGFLIAEVHRAKHAEHRGVGRRLMVRRRESFDWKQPGTRATARAKSPDLFVGQMAAPLFFGRTDTGSGPHLQFDDERTFWARSASSIFGSVCLKDFRLSDWFPRAPGVYWSRRGLRTRQSVYSNEATEHSELGRIYHPQSKMSLIEDGGFGTIRLLPKRIDNTDCWLGSALKGSQCSGAIPLAIPDHLLRTGQFCWGNISTISGQVRLLKDAGLEDIASSVHHACPTLIFVDQIIPSPKRMQTRGEMIITPVALFNFREGAVPHVRHRDYGYTFVQSVAGPDDDWGGAGEWIEKYVDLHNGQIITNFDETSPILANAPLSYQRLVAKTYDRIIIENLIYNGQLLANRIDKVEQTKISYNNYGQAGAFGQNASSNQNKFVRPQSGAPNYFSKVAGRLKRIIKGD